MFSDSTSSPTTSTLKFQRVLHDILGAAAPAVLTLSFGLSFAVLIFSGPLADLLPYGIAATFIASVIIAAVIAFGSSFPFAIGGPETSTAAVTAILAASLAEHMRVADPSAQLLGPTLITLSGATIITGIVLCGLGLTRIGRAIRYVPYPVIGGFLGATALLIVLGGIQVITDRRLQLATLGDFLDALTLYKLLAGCALAYAIHLALHRYRVSLLLPAILVGGIVAAHIVFAVIGLSMSEAARMGWTFQPPPPAHLTLPWTWTNLSAYPWDALPALAGNLVAFVFVAAISTLFNTTGLEVATHREANLERELNVTGIADIVSGLVGGFGGCISLSRSALGVIGGATGRFAGLTVAAVAALMLVLDPVLLKFMPKFVLGGVLIYLGVDQLHRWIIESRKRLSAIEYLSLIAIIVIIVKWGFVAGVLIGVVIGCATFALSAARISSIKFGFDGTEYRSSLDRSRDDLALLAAHGHEIQGLNLQSYLFFGSANRLYQHVRKLLEDRPECRYLLFDFRLVTGIDSSAAYSFAQIKRTALEQDVQLLLVNLQPATEKILRSGQFLSDDVMVLPEPDHALEWCENKIIAEHSAIEQQEGDLRNWFVEIFGNELEADELLHRCRRVEFNAGDIVARAGDPPDSMHFILEGRIGVMVATEEDRSTRLRSLGRYTTVGEMGLVARQPRSATIQAEIDSVLYALPAEAFAALGAKHPALNQKLLTYFMSVMAERLVFANRTIGVLRR